MWALSATAGLLSVLTGLLPLSEARDVLERVAPILLFLVAVTVLAELAEAAEVFDVAAVRVARLGRGNVLVLFGLVALLGATTTVLLSLDTTAVLLTPVVLSLAARLQLNPLPFAFLAVWIANAASLLLPVSNLTNLLALDRLDVSAATFASHTAAPAAVAAAGAVLVVGLRFAGSLRGRYDRPEPFRPEDRLQFRVAAAACIGFAPAVLLGAPAWAAASVAAAVVVLVAAVRQRHQLRWGLVPWRLVLLTIGLFLFVGALGRHGLDDLLSRLIGRGGDLRVTAVAAAAANGVNNLPAYLALERSTPSGDLPALLVGVDVGPLVLLWGSLATLLWRERCRARGVHISAWQFTLLGLAGVPVLLAATVLVLP